MIFFLKFFDEKIRENIVFQTNLYIQQKQKGKSILPTKKRELYGFIGINLLMGYHKLPSWLDYWKCDPDLSVPFASSVMSRRFGQILWNLHVNDNSTIPAENKDRLYKLRPLIPSLKENFVKRYDASRYLSVDESMILFKGQSSMKQYNPKKTIKRGYKLWMIANTDGYINKFDVYQGKFDQVREDIKSFGLGKGVVLSMVDHLHNKNHEVYLDNYFTSIPLLEHLKNVGVHACGTIKANRKFLPTRLKQDKFMQRGESCSQ